jgi:hypothetical protein
LVNRVIPGPAWWLKELATAAAREEPGGEPEVLGPWKSVEEEEDLFPAACHLLLGS